MGHVAAKLIGYPRIFDRILDGKDRILENKGRILDDKDRTLDGKDTGQDT